MCEQTEINYLDGDIVWVKLGACWWPGQVTGFHNLPEDIQIEFKKKSLIAAVKFFQEDTYEFVKNLHQIYKYNCTQKDDFIRKGLDKYRTKSKDGSSYMDKFPGDVEMAEKLTGGDPDILTSEKFGREEKPDISALFGEKKLPKRKRERDEMQRRSEGGGGGGGVGRKITHPRFLRESDHEIRIRQQPSSLPSTPKTPGIDSPQFSCHLCNFTSTRVNVIICHRKSHCSGGIESPISRPRITSHAQPKSSNRPSAADTQKRKYVRKTKSLSSKGKGDSESEPIKRKHTKQIDKVMTKKKKTDPELREKLLADWDDETDDDMDLDANKSADTSSIGSPPEKIANREINSSITENEEDEMMDDGTEIIKASEKLLRETENFSALLGRDSSSRASRQSNNKHLEDDESETETLILTKDEKSPVNKKPKKLIHSAEERQSASSEKDDKQSRFSCFDFDEEDLPESTITPVRKIPRIFGEKNTSVKKEILKKFTMSQALKNEKDDEKIEDKAKNKQDFNEKKVHKAKEKNDNEETLQKRSNVDFLSGKQQRAADKTKGEAPLADRAREKKSSKSNLNVTELEIVEIFEVEGEKDMGDEMEEMTKKSGKYVVQSVVSLDKKIETHDSMEIEHVIVKKDTVGKKKEKLTRRRGKRSKPKKNHDESISEVATTETEDETVSELADSLQGHSENSDTDGTLNQATWEVSSTATKNESLLDDRGNREKPPPRRRGRPRKNLIPVDPSGNGNESPKHEIISKQIVALVTRDSERKTSESDSERSYSGRQRKPNKRYLHEEIYTSSPENRASRTDESQSETEEKSGQQSVVRSRRGKKKSESVIESYSESMEKTKDQEFEFSNRTLDATDRAEKLETTNVMKMDKEFRQVGSILEEGKLDSLETEGESSTSCTVDFMKKLDSGIGSPVNITKLLSSGDSETGSLKQTQDPEARSEILDQVKDQAEGEIRENIDEMEMSCDETKNSLKFDTPKTNVDKLPPKKSQIKKFELSQIDLLDACAQQVAAEQLAEEKLVAEKIAAEKLVAEKIAAEKLAAEKIAAEKLAAEKLAEEKLLAEKLATEKLAAEQAAAEQAAAEQLAEEKLVAEKIAAEKLIAEKIAAEKLAAEKLAEEKLVAEKLATEKLAAEQAAAEQAAAEQIAAEKLAAEKIAAVELAAEKIAAEKLAAEKIIAEKLAAEKIAAEKLAAEKLAMEKIAAEKMAAEKLAADKLAAEKLAAEKLVAEKLAAEKLAAEKVAAEKLVAEKIAAEKLAAEKLVAEQITAERQFTEEIVTNQSTPSSVAKVDVPTEQNEKVIVEVVPVISEKEDSTSLMIVTGNVTKTPMKDSTMETIEAVLARITNEETIEETETSKQTSIPSESKSINESLTETSNKETPKMENLSTSGGTETSQRSTMQTRYKGKFTPETGSKPKKDQESTDEEIPVNSFQEAFLKTLQIDPEDIKDGEAVTADASAQKVKEIAPSQNVQSLEPKIMLAIGGTGASLSSPAHIEENQNLPLNAMTEFEGVEILVQDNIVEVETKMDEGNTSTSQMELAAALVGSDLKNDESTLSLDLQKIQDTLSDTVSTPSPISDVSVPVKKREKPRIIENVALKEPMQILKSKLLEKLPIKSSKHKLDSETPKKGESKGSGPRAKMMKIESPNSKSRSPTKSGGSHFTITRKLQVLKAEEAATAAAIEKEKAAAQIAAHPMSVPASGEKFIQQSSQSLADMELDINSMPFVLSEDVLTPESIEHMPVVISSIIPSSSSSVPTSLTLTPTTQLMTSNQSVQYKSTSETTESTSTGKKKSGTPAILKNKGKGKPTITSIKTLVPPLTGGVKGLKFQSQQATGKAMPLMTQKNTATPGKYVIVQTSGGQQMRYSVQGKPGSQQKIAIPTGKATGSAQIVQQGGKVVILTSAQSGQTKMLPLNISKSMAGKVQKIVNNKGQVYTPLSPQGIMGSKAMIAPKTDTSSPTTSKLAQGQKMINTQGIITSKGVLTPISTSKSGLLGLSPGILTKGGIYTPITSAQLAGKTIIGSKSLVSKATTILSPLGSQALGSKTILSPMSHSLSGKTMINAQGLLTPKGTVLTPITGQQVKALAAKSPAKGATTVTGKMPYQALQQQKLQMFQKKVPVSSSSQMRAGGSVKSPGGGSTIVFQNTMTTSQQKSTTPGGKKVVRQIVQQGVRSPQTTIAQSTNPSSPQILQRGKSLTTIPTVQRIAGPARSGGRPTKTQQKIVVQKLQETPAGGTASSPIVGVQTKQIAAQNPNVKTSSHKQNSRSGKSNRCAQKHLLNIASLSSGSPGSSETSSMSPTPVSTVAATPPQQPNIQTPLVMPPLVIPGTELPISDIEENSANKIEKTSVDAVGQKDNFAPETGNIVEPTTEPPTIETPKIATPPQIMALPTESSDGTQTYVLVTIDEQGQIQPLDNNTLMSLEGTTQNADGTRTLYIDPSSLGEAGTLDNIVLQFDNGALPNLQSTVGESAQTIASTESFGSSEIIQTSNQDILAAALANTDFQQEIGMPENPASSVMTTGLTQTSLINQTILQSTIIPPTEPISSPSVLETSLTLNQPIMTPLEVPSSLPIQVEPAPASVISTIPTSLELPITITDPNISYITATPTATVDDGGHVQMPGNSMPDIGEIMESPASREIVRTEAPATRYLVIPNLDENMTIQAQAVESENDSPSVTYSVSIPENVVIDNSGVQTTPSMPIIDDCYVETTEQNFTQVTVNEMLVSKASTISTEAVSTKEREASQETMKTGKTEKSLENSENNVVALSQDSYVSQEIIVSEQMIVEQQESVSATEEVIVRNEPIVTEQEMPNEHVSAANSSEKEETQNSTSESMQIEEQSSEIVTCVPVMEETCGSSDMHVEETPKNVIIESTNSCEGQDNFDEKTPANISRLDELTETNVTSHEASGSIIQHEERANSPSLDSSKNSTTAQVPFDSTSNLECESMAVEMEVYPENPEIPDGGQSIENSSGLETVETAASENVEMLTESVVTETSQEEAPSQSYEQQFDVSGVTSDSTETPTQSAGKSENSREPSQSIAYESMEVDENTISGEPPTQSFEDTKINEASQSYEHSIEVNTNAPTQSFNEIMQCQEEGTSTVDTVDDQSFPTQSYEVGKMDNVSENLESDAAAIGQEVNIPSQSNDIGNDGIGTSSISVNNSGLNEDETASSSYVPETPENQERDQDQESAISTSSYEIPPCEELNIASSSVIPDTSVRAEHMSIHDNGVPEIPTSSYNLNPDSSSTSHVDGLPTSSYEDQVIVEQNVSTSYEVPISMPGLEETSSQNFVTESTDHRNEPTSYYARHPEVTASYYETANQDSNSRLEADPQEEVTPSYYEQPQQDIGSEASQSYFRSTPRYTSHSVSPSYYDPVPETEASQSYYSHEMEANEQSTSSSRNVEASQSFYQETTDNEMRLRPQGEATPTYTERYPADYALENSPIERHDLVESSVPATRPTER